MQNYEVCQVPSYQINYKSSKKINKPIDIIKNILETDLALHERLHKTDNLKLILDVDKLLKHNPNTNLNKILNDICSYLKINLDDISYTNNKSSIEGSYHIVIPKYFMNSKDQKKLWKQFKKIYNYGAEIDSGIFDKEGWFRLPNQKKETVDGTEHVIIKGENTDFVLKYIDEATEYIIDIPDEVKTIKPLKSKINIPVQVNNKSELNQMWFNEIEFLINNQCFNSHCSTGKHNAWVSIAGMFMFLFYDKWFVLWENLTLQFGTDNKKQEYSYQSAFIKPIGEDSEKVMNTLRMWAKNENIEGYKLWVREQCRINKKEITLEIKENNDEDDCIFPDDNEMPEDEDDNEISFKTEWTTGFLADIFKHNYKHFLYSNDILYNFNGVYWKPDDKNNSTLNNFVDKTFYEFLLNKLFEYDKEHNDGTPEYNVKSNKIRNIIISLRVVGKRKQLIEDIIMKITNNDIEFNNNPYLFAFENKVFDLKKCEFVEPKPEFYITFTTSYNYDENYDINLKQELDDFINKIFIQPELKKLYLTLLSTGLDGIPLEKFVIANGGGGNGKGVLNELSSSLFGNYSYVLPVSILTSPMKTGANPEIANMNNKRFVISREPNVDFKINCSTIKEITGGCELNARVNYSNITKTNLRLSFFFECNEKPKLNEVNDALSRRLMDIPFKSKFVEKQVYDKCDEEEKKYTFIGDSFYKSQEFKTKYRQALFLILIEQYKEYNENKRQLPYTDEIIKRNNDYLESSNDLLGWINESYEMTNNVKDSIKIKTIYEFYKSSEYFANLNKAQKRANNYANFVEKLQKDFFLKKFVKENKDKTKILCCYKIRVDEEVEKINDI